MNRREFIAVLGGAAVWPLAAQRATAGAGRRPQRIATRVILREAVDVPPGIEGDRLCRGPEIGDRISLGGRSERSAAGAGGRVGSPPSRRAVCELHGLGTRGQAATSSIPIVFTTGSDPVELGLTASLDRPGGNIAGVAFLVNKLVAKRLELLSELVPKSATVGMLVDPQNPNAEADVKDAQAAADALGRKVLVVKARSESEIDAAFAALARQRVPALFVAAHTNFSDHRDQGSWR